MAILAIEGHPKRGNEVIGILEMLGGKNSTDFNGASSMYYLIGIIEPKFLCTVKSELDDSYEQFTYFTLEEFLEKFPYKVGDKVNYVKYNDEYPSVYTIQKMRWTGVTIEYLLDSSGFSALTKDLQPYKEETMEEHEHEPEPKAPILSNRYDYAEGKCGYVIPDGYEFDSIKQGFQTEIILRPIKSQYPKTYKECFNICFDNKHHIVQVVGLDGLGDNKELFESFIKLKICRDAYWKIAGEQMGLGKDWEPDFESDIYYIYYDTHKRIFSKDYCAYGINVNHFLVFPTEEIRDIFYENFKELIEQCKELL